MPRPSFNKRKRSTEIGRDFRGIQRAKERRRKNANLFLDRSENVPLGYYYNWDESVVSTAHNGQFVDVDYSVDTDENDLLKYLNGLVPRLRAKIKDAWFNAPAGGVSFNVSVLIKYYGLNDTTKIRWFTLSSDYYQVFTVFDINESIESACEDLMKENEYYQDGGSSWVVDEILKASLMYQSIGASNAVNGGGRFASMMVRRGGAHIEIPKWIMDKKCVVNFQNKDDLCFKYAMECALMHKTDGSLPKNPARVAQYKDKSSFDYGELEFPFHPMDLEVFERLNSMTNVALHVYTASTYNNDVSVLYSSKLKDAWHVNLLLMTSNKQGNQVDTHWLYITNLQAFLRTPHIDHRHLFCERCTGNFPTLQAVTEHQEVCGTTECGAAYLPYRYEKWKYFQGHQNMLEQDFVIYADFEAFNVVVPHKDGESKTDENRITEHVGASFGFHTVCRVNPIHNKTVLYSYPHDDITDKYLIGKEFIKHLELERDRIKQIIADKYSCPLDESTVPATTHQTHCSVCKLDLKCGFMPHWTYKNHRKQHQFKDPAEFFQRLRAMKKKPIESWIGDKLLEENKSIIDIWDAHTGKWLGKSHFACGNNRPGTPGYRRPIPVVFHNLSRYDAHFIIKALNPEDIIKEGRFAGIPQSGDKFMTLSFRGLKFIDSIRFMAESLDILSQNLLKSGKDQFNNFNTYFRSLDDSKRELLLQKGHFPYEYFNHPRVFKETAFPPPQHFYSKLRDEGISPEDYINASYVWNVMDCRTFKDYHDLYLAVDVLLLADIFENFRTICLKQHGLDPVHYVSVPAYSFDSAFIFAGTRMDGDKHVPFTVELFDNKQHDMYLFCEEAIRGGVSMTPGRFSKANHKYLSDWNPEDVARYIFYLDANNLYGHAMIQPLPYADYAWVKKPEDIDLMAIPSDYPEGYIFEVDGFFPDNVHDRLSDFPPAPVKKIVEEDMISPFSANLNKLFNNKHDDKTTKLLCTLEPKTKYKCYYRTLQLYVNLGFTITKVHRILSFKQGTWLAGYIQHNTTMRAKCTSAFEKDFYKLLNNSVYGKFIQNNRKHKEIKALTPGMPRQEWSPFLQGRRIINENFVLGYLSKPKVELNSPMAIGCVILDHSKHLMYDFYYNVMKSRYNQDIRLIFTDTDSLCMEISNHEDPMKDMKNDGLLDQWFDLSDFPADTSMYGSNYNDSRNKKVIGKFKDEFPTVYIKECIALRSKMYSCLKSDGKNKLTAKGVASAVRKKLLHEKYMQCLFPKDGQALETEQNISFRSDNNIIYTIGIDKVTLSPCDSKLYLLDATHTKPFGHYSLRNISSS